MRKWKLISLICGILITIFGIYLLFLQTISDKEYLSMKRGVFDFYYIDRLRKLPLSDKDALKYNESLMYYRIKKAHTSIKIASQLLKETKDNNIKFKCHYFLGWIYFLHKSPKTSLEHLKNALRIDPFNLEAKLLLEKLYKDSEMMKVLKKRVENYSLEMDKGDLKNNMPGRGGKGSDI